MIKKLLYSYKKRWIIISLITIFESALLTTSIALSSRIYESGYQKNWSSFLFWLGISFSLASLFVLFTFFSKVLLKQLQVLTTQRIRQKQEEKLQKISFLIFANERYFKTAYIFDVKNYVFEKQQEIVSVLSRVTTFLAAFVNLLILNIYLGLLGLICFILLFGFSYVYKKTLKERKLEINKAKSQANNQLDKTLSSFKRLLFLGKTNVLLEANKGFLNKYAKTKKSFNFFSNVRNWLSNGASKIIDIFLTLFLGFVIIQQNGSIGLFIAGTSLFFTLTLASDNLGSSFSKIWSLKSVEQKIDKLFSLANKKDVSSYLKGQIELRNITLNFHNKNILSNFNLQIKENEKVLICGKTGSGKSSLIKAILGLLKPLSGKVSWSKEEVNFDKVVKNTLFVSNKPLMFGESIEQNITLFDQKKDLKKLSLAKNKSKIDFMNQDVSKLSTGQKQRVEIATSLYHDAQTIIFDESFSNIDYKTSSKIIDKLLKIKNKRIIMISHHIDNQDKKKFDKVIDLDYL